MSLLRRLPLLCCLGLLRGEGPRGPQGSHSLRYLFSFVSEPLPGAPQYSVVGYVDEVAIIGYTSESGRAGPRAPWMETITDEEPQYWENSRETFEEVKKTLNESLRSHMQQKNQPPGLHVIQMMLGCELREDGSIEWFERFAYDGSNLTSTTDPATDPQDQGTSEESLNCVKELKNHLKYGEESLRRRVTPQTRVSQRKAIDRTFLIGYVYGFYPRDMEVKWVRDGVEIPWESRELLPNPDGTYQVRTTVEVQEGDDVMTYEYHVNHSSLTKSATVEYYEHRRLRHFWAVYLLLLLPLLVLVLFIRRRSEHWKGRPTQQEAVSQETAMMTGDAPGQMKPQSYIEVTCSYLQTVPL